MAAEQKVVELVIDASGVERGVQRIEVAYDHLGARGDAAAIRMQAAFDRQLQSFSTKAPRSIDQVASAYDNLQAKVDPVFQAQLRAEREMTKSLEVINRAVMLGVATEQQATAVISQLKAQQVEALLRVRAANDNAASSSGDLSARVERLRQAFDPAYVAAGNLQRELNDLAEAERLGIQISGGYDAALSSLILKHDAVAAAAHRQAAAYVQLAADGRQGLAADQFQRQINSQMGISDPAMVAGNARASAAVFEDAAREADRLATRVAALRAQIDPAGTAQARMNDELAEYSVLAARAEISTTELAQAQALARSRYDAVVGDEPGMAGGDRNGNFRRQNAMYQYFDIGQGLAGGMPIGMIAAQQGPQLAQLYAGQGGLKAAASDVGSIASGALAAIGPLGIAFGVAGSAALAYYALTRRETKTTEELLKTHQESISRVATLWGDAAEQRSKYGRVSTDVVTLGLDNSINAMTKRLQENVSSGDVGAGISSAINMNRDATGLNAGQFRETSIYKALQVDLDALHEATVAGRPDIIGLIGRLQDIRRSSDNPGIRKMADDAVDALKPFRDLAEALREANLERRRLFEDRGENGRLLSRGTSNTSDMSAYAAFAERQRISALRSQQAFDAQIASLNARSPQQKADAARQSASAQHNDDETAPDRRLRIEQAGTLALAQAEKTLTEAREARARNIGKIITDQQLEILLLGKTAGETAALRREYELVNQLKEEARQNGGIVDEGEIARIKQSAAEVGRLTDQLASMRLQQDAAFEREQLFRSSREAAVAAGLRGAGREVDLASQDAAMLRSLEILKEQKQAWEDIRDVGRSAIDDIVDGMSNGFENGADIFKSILKDINKEMLSLAVSNPLKNAIYGDNLPTMDSVGGLGGIFKALTGGKFPGADAASKAVGAMTVTAASVVVNGGVGASDVGSLLAANDNGIGKASVGEVLRMALPDAGVTKTGIPLSEITAAGGLKAKVNAQYADRFQGLLNDLKSAGYNVTSLGEGGYSYRNVAGTKNLSKHSFGEALDINPRQNPWSNKFQTDLPANVNDIAKRNGLTWGGTWNKPDTMHFQVDKSANTAALALNKMATNAGAATQNLGTFGNGLGSFGDALSKFPAAPQGGSGGGLMGWLGNLFGGAATSLPSMFSGSAQAAAAFASPGMGLYANGGFTGQGGVNDPAGIVHRGEVVWSQADIARAGGVGAVEGMRRGSPVSNIPRIVATQNAPRQTVNRQVNIINAPPGYYPEVEEEDDDQGNEKVNVTFSKMGASEAGRPGSPLNKQLKKMGAKSAMVRR